MRSLMEGENRVRCQDARERPFCTDNGYISNSALIQEVYGAINLRVWRSRSVQMAPYPDGKRA